jgi:hypothetical protein
VPEELARKKSTKYLSTINFNLNENSLARGSFIEINGFNSVVIKILVNNIYLCDAFGFCNEKQLYEWFNVHDRIDIRELRRN